MLKEECHHHDHGSGFLDKLVIKIDSKWKQNFDVIIRIVCAYSVYSNAFYAAYESPHSAIEIVIDQISEFFFFFDMIFCFFQEYTDEESYSIVSCPTSIMKHYLRGSFVYDFLAWIPIDLILFQTGLVNSEKYPNLHLIRILKMLRIPRFSQLLDVENFKQVIYRHYDKKLYKAVQENEYRFTYPVLF